MPTPERTSLEEMVAAARVILEQTGLPGLTMQAVAERVGVRAPSLYKRVKDRDALVALVVEATGHDLSRRLAGAHGIPDLVRGFRAFAREWPAGFRLMTTASSPETLARASAPVLQATAALAGEEHALSAARLVTAWVVGFVQMELAGEFRLGGDLDEAFEYGLDRVTRSLALP